MSSERTRTGFWRTLPGVLTAVAGLVTAVATLLGALAATGLLSGGSGGTRQESAAALVLPADAELAAARIESGCLGFFGDTPSQCRCFGRTVAAAIRAEELDQASRTFRAEGRFAAAAHQAIADDAVLRCRSAGPG